MSTASIRFTLALVVAGFLVAAVGQTASAQLLTVGNYHATNNSTYDKWYENRIWLGQTARSNEYAVTARNGTRGTVMHFEKGSVYRISEGRHAGETYFMNGGINAKYLQMGGISSKAGFPIGDAKRLSPTAGHAQAFQGGMIVWNVQQKLFVYYPYQFGDR